MKNIAVVGMGEAGRCYIRALAAAGYAIQHVCEPMPTEAARALVEQIGATLHSSAGSWLQDVDIVLSAVSGGAALSVASACVSHMRPGALYADLSTASPDAMRSADEAARNAEVDFVDVAIMGGITLSGAKTPLLCAGRGSADFAAALAPLGMRIRVIEGGKAGDAVILKLLRSIFVKGMEALAVECLVLAESQGLRPKLYENLSDIDEAHLPDFLNMLVRTHVIHAGRRLHEVESAEEQLKAAGFEPRVTAGVKALFERSCSALAREPVTPEISVEQALSRLIESARTPAGIPT